MSGDATFNFQSYAECFISENLIRKVIDEEKIQLSEEAKAQSRKFRERETESKNRGNISIDVRRVSSDLSYLDMDSLANLVDKAKDRINDPGLSRDAIEYKPMRDAVAHTALLTDAAKHRLSTVRENIKGRIKNLLTKAT